MGIFGAQFEEIVDYQLSVPYRDTNPATLVVPVFTQTFTYGTSSYETNLPVGVYSWLDADTPTFFSFDYVSNTFTVDASNLSYSDIFTYE